MSYLNVMRKERDASVVTKTEFATFLSGVPSDCLVFIFEGRDDKVAYGHWLRSIGNSIKYEALIKKNKDGVLKLFDALSEDLTGIFKRTRYFVDRDFDDLKGRPISESIFMTDFYAIENYCVNSEVLDCVLKEDFHCNGITDVRQEVVNTFENSYAEFLLETQSINLRIFLGRRLRLVGEEKFPSRLNQIASVHLRGAKLIDNDLKNIIPLLREPTEEEFAELSAEFFELHPANRYRGKFAIMFFSRWLELMRADRCSEKSEFFAKYGELEFKVKGDFSFDKLISKAPPPPGLYKFLEPLIPDASVVIAA